MGKADLCGSGYQLLSNENWKFSSEELTSSFEWLSISDKRCASRVSSCVQQGRRMDSLDWKHRKLQDAVTGLKSQTSVPLPPPSPPIVLPYLEQGAQGHIQVGLDVSKEEIPQPLWSLCQVSGTGTVQQCCPVSRRNQSLVTVFQLVPIKDNTVLKLWCTSYFFFTICWFILKEFPFFLLICLKEKHFTRERRSAVQKELLCWVLFQPCKHWGPLQAIPPHSRASSAQFGLLSAELGVFLQPQIMSSWHTGLEMGCIICTQLSFFEFESAPQTSTTFWLPSPGSSFLSGYWIIF